MRRAVGTDIVGDFAEESKPRGGPFAGWGWGKRDDPMLTAGSGRLRSAKPPKSNMTTAEVIMKQRGVKLKPISGRPRAPSAKPHGTATTALLPVAVASSSAPAASPAAATGAAVAAASAAAQHNRPHPHPAASRELQPLTLPHAASSGPGRGAGGGGGSPKGKVAPASHQKLAAVIETPPRPGCWGRLFGCMRAREGAAPSPQGDAAAVVQGQATAEEGGAARSRPTTARSRPTTARPKVGESGFRQANQSMKRSGSATRGTSAHAGAARPPTGASSSNWEDGDFEELESFLGDEDEDGNAQEPNDDPQGARTMDRNANRSRAFSAYSAAAKTPPRSILKSTSKKGLSPPTSGQLDPRESLQTNSTEHLEHEPVQPYGISPAAAQAAHALAFTAPGYASNSLIMDRGGPAGRGGAGLPEAGLHHGPGGHAAPDLLVPGHSPHNRLAHLPHAYHAPSLAATPVAGSGAAAGLEGEWVQPPPRASHAGGVGGVGAAAGPRLSTAGSGRYSSSGAAAAGGGGAGAAGLAATNMPAAAGSTCHFAEAGKQPSADELMTLLLLQGQMAAAAVEQLGPMVQAPNMLAAVRPDLALPPPCSHDTEAADDAVVPISLSPPSTAAGEVAARAAAAGALGAEGSYASGAGGGGGEGSVLAAPRSSNALKGNSRVRFSPLPTEDGEDGADTRHRHDERGGKDGTQHDDDDDDGGASVQVRGGDPGSPGVTSTPVLPISGRAHDERVQPVPYSGREGPLRSSASMERGGRDGDGRPDRATDLARSRGGSYDSLVGGADGMEAAVTAAAAAAAAREGAFGGLAADPSFTAPGASPFGFERTSPSHPPPAAFNLQLPMPHATVGHRSSRFGTAPAGGSLLATPGEFDGNVGLSRYDRQPSRSFDALLGGEPSVYPEASVAPPRSESEPYDEYDREDGSTTAVPAQYPPPEAEGCKVSSWLATQGLVPQPAAKEAIRPRPSLRASDSGVAATPSAAASHRVNTRASYAGHPGAPAPANRPETATNNQARLAAIQQKNAGRAGAFPPRTASRNTWAVDTKDLDGPNAGAAKAGARAGQEDDDDDRSEYSPPGGGHYAKLWGTSAGVTAEMRVNAGAASAKPRQGAQTQRAPPSAARARPSPPVSAARARATDGESSYRANGHGRQHAGGHGSRGRRSDYSGMGRGAASDSDVSKDSDYDRDNWVPNTYM